MCVCEYKYIETIAYMVNISTWKLCFFLEMQYINISSIWIENYDSLTCK